MERGGRLLTVAELLLRIFVGRTCEIKKTDNQSWRINGLCSCLLTCVPARAISSIDQVESFLDLLRVPGLGWRDAAQAEKPPDSDYPANEAPPSVAPSRTRDDRTDAGGEGGEGGEGEGKGGGGFSPQAAQAARGDAAGDVDPGETDRRAAMPEAPLDK